MFLSVVILINLMYYSSCLNIMFINDDKNDIAEEMLKETLSKLQADNSVIEVSGINEKYQKFQSDLCKKYAQMVNSGKPPDVIFDTTLTGLISDCGNKFTASLGLPTFTTSYGLDGDMLDWNDLTDDQRKYLIQLNPPNELIPEIVRSIVFEQGYLTAAVLVDENYEISHKYKSLLQNLPVRHTIANINMTHTIQQLLEIKKNTLYNIFIIASLKNIRLVLSSADAISHFTEAYSWHAITHERGVLQCPCKKAKVFFAQTIFANVQQKATLFSQFYSSIFEIAYNATLQAYVEINNTNLSYIKCEEFNGTNTPHRNGLDLRKHFLMLSQNNGFSQVEQGALKMNFEMSLSYVDFREGSLYRTQLLGSWDANFDGNLNLTKPQIFKEHASKTIYRVITRTYPPFVYKDDSVKRGYTGYCIDLLDEIAAILGFDYQLLEVVDGEMGSVDEDGTWNGLIRELVEGRADIALSALSVTAQREQAVDFTVPYYEMIGHSILLKVHERRTSMFRFLQVFDREVWFTLIAVYVATSIFMWILYKLSPFGYRYVKRESQNIRDFNLLECLWFCLISVAPAGGGEAPINSSGRIMAGFWWFFCYIMYSCYSANLAAFLTVNRFDSGIKSLDDLVTQYTMKYSTMNNSGTQEYFRKMANIEERLLKKWEEMNIGDTAGYYETSQYAVWDYPLSDKFMKIWKSMEAIGFPNSIDEAVEMVRASAAPGEGFAIILDAVDSFYLSMANCDLESVDEFFKRPLALAIQKGSPLKDSLSDAILKLSNRRVLANLKDKWWNLNPERKDCVFDNQSDSVDIANIGGIFLYLLCAVVGIIMITTGEYCYKKRIRQKIRDWLHV